MIFPLFFAFAACFARLLAYPTNADAAWYLYIAGEILDGAVPYRDFCDTNPPLILLINMAIVGLARATRNSPLAAFPATILGLIVLSLTLSWRRSREFSPALRQAILIAWAYALLVQVGPMFGQREHLLLILVLPYAMGAVAECRGERPGRAMAIASGLMAGLGFATKPFFVIPLAAIEIFLATRRGISAWKRPEALAIGCVFVAYAGVLLGWTPEYFSVARRFAPLYPHYQPGGSLLLASSWRLLNVLIMIAIAWNTARRKEPGWVEIFALLAIGLAVCVYLTGKGWDYHWYPVVATAISLAAGSAAVVAAGEPPRRARIAGVLGFCVAVPMLCLFSIFEARSSLWQEAETLRLVRSQTGPGDAVLVLSPRIHTAFPMINHAGVAWGMRHPMLWQIGAFCDEKTWTPGHYRPIEAMSVAERRFVGEVAEDFAAKSPRLLLVDSEPPSPSLEGFDYLAYFAEDPRFARQLARYEFSTKLAGYRVYRLRDPSPPLADR